MLPLSTKSLQIYLDPNYIAVVQFGGLFRRKVLERNVIRFDHSSREKRNKNLKEKLTKLLSNSAYRGNRASVILSSYFTRQRIAQWHDSLSEEDQKTIMQDQLMELYGLKENTFEVFLSHAGYQQNRLAFSFNKELLEVVAEGCREFNIHLRTVTPYFALMVNYWHQLIAPNAWLIIKEDFFFHVAKIQNRNWVHIRTYPLKEQEEVELIKTYSRELLHQGIEDDYQVYVNADATLQKALGFVLRPNQSLQVLENTHLKDFKPNLAFAAYC